jgi:hypothetical protein
MPTTIYGLYYYEPTTPSLKSYFYVGRSKDMFRRERQHRFAMTKGHEDKYEFMRSLDERGLQWHIESLREIPDNEYPPDNERWFVIKLTREGHTLKNMRHGSEEHLRELAGRVKSPSIGSVSDICKDRVTRKFAASRKFRRKMLEMALKKTGIPDIAADKILPKTLRNRLLARNCISIARGVALADIFRLERAAPMFARLSQMAESAAR